MRYELRETAAGVVLIVAVVAVRYCVVKPTLKGGVKTESTLHCLAVVLMKLLPRSHIHS